MDLLDKKNILPLIDQAIVSGGNALIQIIMLRVFGLDEYGVYAFVMIFIMGFLSMNQAVIVLPFQVFFSKGIYESKTINTLQFQFLLVVVFISLLFGGLNFLFGWIDTSLILPVCLYGVGYLLNDFVRKKMFVHDAYKRVVIHDILVLTVQLILIGVTFFMGLSMIDYLYFIGLVLITIEFFFFGKFNFYGVSKSVYKEHWVFSKWLIASTFTQWFSGNLLISSAGIIMGTWALGVVRIGQTINGVLGVLFQLMEAYFPSKVSAEYQKNGLLGLKIFLKKIAFKATSLTVLIALMILLVKDQLIELLYGQDLVQYSFIMYWFTTLLVISVLNIVLRFYIRTLSMNRIVFESYVLLFLYSVISSTFLVHNWGLNGIGFGLVSGQLLICIWFYLRITFPKQLLIDWYRRFFVLSKDSSYE